MTQYVGNTSLSLPLVDSSLGTKLLPAVLSVIAGSVDVMGFLGLTGLLTGRSRHE